MTVANAKAIKSGKKRSWIILPILIAGMNNNWLKRTFNSKDTYIRLDEERRSSNSTEFKRVRG